ncbi:hypothetical protein [Methylibium sp.]|uniref:DUF7482 domain-containing protein n=1 Tax=Methylibium sp. TaxID=2067992 RepID=UPI0017912855|nr:hypothetical protein [Methylibium sp.]MBA3588746.1 hypothetical protein [Methylibium sp.]
MQGRSRAAALLLVLGIAACAGAPTSEPARGPQVSLPLHLAWFEGAQVHYVTTDVSDAAMARDLGVNHVALLANAASPAGSPPGTRTAVDLVYAFPGGEQINVFASAPAPAGPDNANRAYSPLWQVVVVRWAEGRGVRALTSEEAVLDAAEKGDVSITRTRIVVNCPVVRSADGRALRGVR